MLYRGVVYAAVCASAFAVFLLPALINRFPLVFVDSGTYLRAAIERFSPPDRPVYYSIFLYLIHWRTSLWPVVFVQAAISVAVAEIFLRRNLGRLPHLHLSLLLLLFSVFTDLSVFICQIMPDLFTPLMVLSLCNLVFSNSRLNAVERWFLYLVVLAAICFHQANFLIAAMTLLSAFLLRTIARNRPTPARSFLAPSLIVILGVVLLILPNLKHHSFAITRGSNVFFLAKLIDDGVALDYLTIACPTRHYSICPQLPAIRLYNKTMTRAQKRDNPASDYFLWKAPLRNSGGWDAVNAYAGAASLASIEREPGTFARTSFDSFISQLLRFKTGDGLSRSAETSFVSGALRMYFPRRVYRAFLESRQERGELPFQTASLFYRATAIAGALAILVLLTRVGTDPVLTSIALTLITAVIGNAFIMGVLSAVHDRYQDRVSCLIVMAAILLGYRRFHAADRATVGSR